ncbi:GNAT family N-acetyltransferase [Halalkalibacter alkalisediminis]|uniref:Enhanced intracellular survival protein Eis n=1 Tax=Halalkalibacter alkalisediminis TaxID=935616 RepID=A0ABV6NAK0_9BACI|nr:GNAT family N-acetyltransferase [Halalkalibacter alkalisediminis]
MTIVRLDEDKYVEAIRLSEYAFQYKVTEDQMAERLERLKKHHELIGIIEEDQLVAKLHFLPLTIYMNKKEIKMGGIAGVATYPEHRRKGYVKEMLIHILKQMKEEHYSVSMLYPFSVPFYREYGWELFSDKLTVTMAKSDLRFDNETQGKMRRYSKEPPIHVLAEIYEQYAIKFTGMLVRDQDWWDKVVKDEQVAIYYDAAENATGYLIYTVIEKKMKVEEMVSLNAEAKRGLWNYICQHDSMINELELITYEREPLLFSLKEPRVKREVTPYFMARIVDVEMFLSEYSFNWSNQSDNVVLEVTDVYAPWNNHCFLVGKSGISILEQDQVEEEKVIKLSINALTAMLFGYQRPEELAKIDHIQSTEVELNKLELMIPHRKPFFYDFF